MARVKSKIRPLILHALLIPYTVSLFGLFSSYFAFFHRTSFQLEVASKDNGLKVLTFSRAEFEGISWTDGRREFERDG
ncbi:MAG TPA: hypothetical protein VKQ08_07680, partial [Cyclobacteriaceae bacterium]|nr:hypothetical protein [Cyclobacteriaceae bacterium]